MLVEKMNNLPDLFDGAPGFDLETGLRTVGGRTERLYQLLKTYEALHARDIVSLRAGAFSGQRQDARRLAHSLKGVAGFLGLIRVHVLADQLEAALLAWQCPDEVKGLLDLLEAENDRICVWIRALSIT